MKRCYINSGLRAVLCCVATIAVCTASARTVYNAGAALRANCDSGKYANPYTDANGGVWSYHTSTTVAPFNDLSNFSTHKKIDNDQLNGWGGDASPHLKVNVTGAKMYSSGFVSDGNVLDVDEMVFHPAAGSVHTVLRFTVQEDGWYSAFVSFHDTALQTQAVNPDTPGAAVFVTLGSADSGDNILAKGVVAQEDVSGCTRRFDFQMPVRKLTAGMRITIAVGNNGGYHHSDATGVKFIVTKEDEGSFFDSGRALKYNLENSSQNPFGNDEIGSWYWLLAKTHSIPQGIAFANWASANFAKNISRLATTCTRASSSNQRGFAMTVSGSSPYIIVNESDALASGTAPLELNTHPTASSFTEWTTLRFRPPRSGWYSASIVARDTAISNEDGSDGVEVFLLVANQVVTNAVISDIDHIATAHIEFASRLLAAGEPIDIVVSPRSGHASDATALSAIFRREDGIVYDASSSFISAWKTGSKVNPISDAIDNAAKWQFGAKTNTSVVSQFYPLGSFLVCDGSVFDWFVYASGSTQAKGDLPRIAVSPDGVMMRGEDDPVAFLTTDYLLRLTPGEMYAHPNVPGYQSSSPTVRAIVPSDGIYRVRAQARDLSQDFGANNADGIRFCIGTGGSIPAYAIVSHDTLPAEGGFYEASIDGDSLWLKAGACIDAVIDPGTSHQNDATGLSVCYVKEREASARVINVDFVSEYSGILSSFDGPGREGWSTWNKWNSLKIGDSSIALRNKCREGDGETYRNVAVSVERVSGAAIAKGSADSGNSLCDAWIASFGTDDTYTFTISSLEKNARYTLYLYSAKGSSTGNAIFSVDEECKGVEESWFFGDGTKVLTRFYATSDGEGKITGTYRAVSSEGAAFNGFTIVGGFPKYVPKGAVVVFR